MEPDNKINKKQPQRLVIVERERFRQAIILTLADREMTRIIECVMQQSKSVPQIIRESCISHSTAYRKIKWMLEEGLLLTEKIGITPDGKKFSLVKSTLTSININYDKGNIFVNVEYNLDGLEKATERFFSLDSNE